jgi:hypothetical protein
MNMLMGLLTAGLAIAFTAVSIWNYRHIRNGEWHTYRRDKMRRWVKGEWQIRRATSDEARDNDLHKFSI